MFKKIHVVVAVSALLLTACGQSNTSSVESAAPTVAASFPVTIENNGTSVVIPEQPDAIISLSPTATEMLFAIDAGSQVVAVDDMSNFPAEAPKTDLSGFQPNLEAIAAFAPDLVILSDDMNGVVAGLQALSIPVLLEPAAANLDESYMQIREIGLATGNGPKAELVIADMESKVETALAKIGNIGEGISVYHELDPTFYSVTSDTFIGQIYKLVGVSNIADAATDASSGYPQLSAEFIVSSDPSIIFLADVKCCSQSLEEVAKRPGFEGLSAVVSGNVVELDDDIASRWGPRTPLLIDEVASAISALAKP